MLGAAPAAAESEHSQVGESAGGTLDLEWVPLAPEQEMTKVIVMTETLDDYAEENPTSDPAREAPREIDAMDTSSSGEFVIFRDFASQFHELIGCS